MKKIDSIIHARNWDETRSVLQAHEVSATLREVKTFGRTPAKEHVYRGVRYQLEVTPELELTALVRDDSLEAVVQALLGVNPDAEIQVSSVECFSRSREQRRAPQPRAIAVRAVPVAVPVPRAVHA